MCRFVAYHGPPISLADLLTRPTHSIIHQSTHAKERREPLNGDGFGLAWYAQDDPIPALFKDVTPAWNNPNLLDLARVVRSGAVLAHVRAATQGLTVMRANCHPFTHGPFSWMHNGDVGSFAKVRRALLARLSDEAFAAIRGTTDSEHAFGLWIDHHRAATASTSLGRMKRALEQTLDSLRDLTTETGMPCTLNLAVSDGVRFVASRAVIGNDPGNTLYWRKGRNLQCVGGVCTLDPEQDGAVLVASEPLFERESWQSVPMNSILTVDENATVTVSPLPA